MGPSCEADGDFDDFLLFFRPWLSLGVVDGLVYFCDVAGSYGLYTLAAVAEEKLLDGVA